MKKFKQLFEASAQDYKQKKDDDAEVKDIKPRSKGEEDFVAQHKIEKKKQPVAPDEVHTGDRPKGKKGKTGEDHEGADEKGEPILKTYTQFAKMGGFGGDSYKGVGKSAGEKATVMQGSSKVSEEVDLDEAFNAGSLKLKSGETVKLNDSNAKALNSAMERLSGRNQLAMKAEVLKDKKSFEAMIKFAKSVT
jgi:hypothetical protein